MTATQQPERLHGVPAPAKLNLFLHVTGRRADGYHLLQSVFMLIDWCDTLHFDLRRDGRLRRTDALNNNAAALPEHDLVLRAAHALREHAGCRLGADIVLEKRLPMEAGLGGGSSDAASTLIALNRLWGLGLPRAELARIGLALGADVPFFIHGRNAWVEGVGETLTPIAVPPARFAVLKPRAGVSTQDIFLSEDLKRDTIAATIADFAAHGIVFGHNDLQPVAEKACPEIREALDWLARQGLSPRMTGSGSAVFAQMLPGVRLAPAPEHWTLRECGNMDVHPLHGWCDG